MHIYSAVDKTIGQTPLVQLKHMAAGRGRRGIQIYSEFH